MNSAWVASNFFSRFRLVAIFFSAVLAMNAWACGPQGGDGDDAGLDADIDASVADAEPEVDADVSMFDHPAKVIHVADGDTITVLFNGVEQRIRFLGVNTPEMSPTPQPCAVEAKDMTAYYAKPSTYVGLEFDDERCANPNPPDGCTGYYGRLLAYIRTRDGGDLGAILLASGLAEVYEPADFARKADYEAIQTQAQQSGLCMWTQ